MDSFLSLVSSSARCQIGRFLLDQNPASSQSKKKKRNFNFFKELSSVGYNEIKTVVLYVITGPIYY